MTEKPFWSCIYCGAYKGVTTPNMFDFQCNSCRNTFNLHDIYPNAPEKVAEIMGGHPDLQPDVCKKCGHDWVHVGPDEFIWNSEIKRWICPKCGERHVQGEGYV